MHPVVARSLDSVNVEEMHVYWPLPVVVYPVLAATVQDCPSGRLTGAHDPRLICHPRVGIVHWAATVDERMAAAIVKSTTLVMLIRSTTDRWMEEGEVYYSKNSFSRFYPYN